MLLLAGGIIYATDKRACVCDRTGFSRGGSGRQRFGRSWHAGCVRKATQSAPRTHNFRECLSLPSAAFFAFIMLCALSSICRVCMARFVYEIASSRKKECSEERGRRQRRMREQSARSALRRAASSVYIYIKGKQRVNNKTMPRPATR